MGCLPCKWMFLCPIKYFTIYCFSKILQNNKYNIFIAEIESNNIFFWKNIFKYNISHPCLHVLLVSDTSLFASTLEHLQNILFCACTCIDMCIDSSWKKETDSVTSWYCLKCSFCTFNFLRNFIDRRKIIWFHGKLPWDCQIYDSPPSWTKALLIFNFSGFVFALNSWYTNLRNRSVK